MGSHVRPCSSVGLPGPNPVPDMRRTFGSGEAAARIHRAAEGFAVSSDRETYDAAILVDDQLRRMRPVLQEAGQWRTVAALGERLKARLAAAPSTGASVTWISRWTTCIWPRA